MSASFWFSPHGPRGIPPRTVRADNNGRASERKKSQRTMSSIRMAVFPATFPTKTILETSFAFLRSLWKRANSRLSFPASEDALRVRQG